MIRRIVGASLHVATKNDSALLLLQKVMAACNPAHTLPNAPAQGLMLCKIIYMSSYGSTGSPRTEQ